MRLVHPNIVGVTDVGEYDGLPFAVMRFLSGGSLSSRLYPNGSGPASPLDPGAAVGDLAGIGQALDFIHGQGYIHRDVKPDNILFDPSGHAFLSDFGIAKALAAQTEGGRQTVVLTGVGMAIGTPEYMAPEVIEGKSFDGRADQYALAATLYEVLSGRVVFTGPTSAAIWVQHITKRPPRLDEIRPGLPRAPGDVVASGTCQEAGGSVPGLPFIFGRRPGGVAEAFLHLARSEPAPRSRLDARTGSDPAPGFAVERPATPPDAGIGRFPAGHLSELRQAVPRVE